MNSIIYYLFIVFIMILIKIYDFTNKSSSDLVIKDRMFYKEGMVFAVSIEKLSNSEREVILKPNELTRVFMVFKNKES